MANLTVLKQNNKTILKNGRKIYATITYNKNPEYKFILWLKNGIALSGYDNEQNAINKANEMNNAWQNVLLNIK